jgi:hypothetical protein
MQPYSVISKTFRLFLLHEIFSYSFLKVLIIILFFYFIRYYKKMILFQKFSIDFPVTLGKILMANRQNNWTLKPK